MASRCSLVQFTCQAFLPTATKLSLPLIFNNLCMYILLLKEADGDWSYFGSRRVGGMKWIWSRQPANLTSTGGLISRKRAVRSPGHDEKGPWPIDPPPNRRGSAATVQSAADPPIRGAIKGGGSAPCTPGPLAQRTGPIYSRHVSVFHPTAPCALAGLFSSAFYARPALGW